MTSNLEENFLALFKQQRYQAILDQVEQEEVNPAADPNASKLVAASLFQLSRYSDCLLWCEGIAPSLGGDAGFSSMYGAVLRRLGKLEEAEKVFRDGLMNHPDDPFLRNNFANLLIDRQSFDEAEKILKALIEQNPNYEDAKANLNRLGFQRDLASDESPKSASKSKPEGQSYFSDPLMDAFSDEEIKHSQGISLNAKSDQGKNKTLEGLPDRQISEELQEALTLARQTIDTSPEKCISDCRLLHAKLGPQSQLYTVVGEAYIRLQLFSDAELALLNALGLGSSDASVLINLANLAAMRGDQHLSIHWLDRLAQQQPDHPQIDEVRRTLFPNGVPNSSTNPFQIHLEQKVPGSFS